ncbi:uncharacterized protein [Panulirus ornatus]|uniref:uncharacterized protein n=1 Tax=Panulirus ornatus TaxID=150431 RepID=UPI003A87D6F3
MNLRFSSVMIEKKMMTVSFLHLAMNSRRASFSWWVRWWAGFCLLTRASAGIVSATAALDDFGAPSPPINTWITLQGECQDRHAECQSWAELGECAINPDFMEPHCPSSCNTCPTDPICEDENDQCVAWSQRGECEINPSYMLQYCLIACTTLGTRSELGHKMFPFMPPTVASTPIKRGHVSSQAGDKVRGSSHSQGLGHEGGRKTTFASERWHAGVGGGRQDTTVASGVHVGCGEAAGQGHGEGRKDRDGGSGGRSLGLSSIVNRRLGGGSRDDNRVSGHRGASGGPSYASSEGLSHGESTDEGRGKSGGVSGGDNEGMSDSGNGGYHHRKKRTISLLSGVNEWNRGLSYSPGYHGSNCNPIQRVMARCARPSGVVRRRRLQQQQPEVAYPRQQSGRQQRAFPFVLQWLPQLPGKLQKIAQLISSFQPQQFFVSRQPPMYRRQVSRQPQVRCGPLRTIV